MNYYLTTNDEQYVAYGVQYVVKLFRVGQQINTCNSYLGLQTDNEDPITYQTIMKHLRVDQGSYNYNNNDA